MAQTSLIIGDTNWAVKEDSLLGYNVIQNKYLPIPIDCVRATTATRVNEQGLIEVVPRNLLTYSEQFENADWVKSGSGTASAPIVSTNSVISPINIQNAEKITFDLNGGTSSSDLSWLYQNVSTIIGLNYTFSAYVKASAIDDIGKQIRIGGITYSNTITLTSNWQRVSITETATNINTSFGFRLRGTEITNDVSMDLWGAQVENFAIATEYFPTTNRLDIPRIDYSTGTAALLVEPQRTNLDITSQTFTAWTLNNSGGVTTSTITTANPYAFPTVQKVIPSAVLGQHRPLLSTNYSAAGKFWVIAKADGYNYLSLGDGGGLAGSSIIFNLLDGTISGTAGGFIPSITSLGNGWYKCSMNTTFVGLTGRWVIIRNNNTTADYIGDGTSGILFAHKQMEVGSYDTSSILTNGSTVTRNADIVSNSNLISKGLIVNDYTLVLDITNPILGNQYILDSRDISSVRTGILRVDGTMASVTDIGGGSSLSILSILTIGKGKMCLKRTGNVISFFANGVKCASTTTTTAGTINTLATGVINSTTGSYINSISLFPLALTDTECITLTTL